MHNTLFFVTDFNVCLSLLKFYIEKFLYNETYLWNFATSLLCKFNNTLLPLFPSTTGYNINITVSFSFT